MISRMIALLIGTLALASLRGQFDTLPDRMALWPVEQKLWDMAGYFAILTNLGVAGLMFAVARGWRMPASIAAQMLVSVAIMGVAYQLTRTGNWEPEGLVWWADQGLHTWVPLAAGLWWWGFADKGDGWPEFSGSATWPAIYCGYVLVRWFLIGLPYERHLDGDLLWVVQFGIGLAGYVSAFPIYWLGG